MPALSVGANTVTTGPEGYAEWRTVSSVSLLTVDIGARWRAYDAGMNVLGGGTTYPAEVEVPAGGSVCLFAPAGTSAAVHLEPSAHGGAAPAPSSLLGERHRRPELVPVTRRAHLRWAPRRGRVRAGAVSRAQSGRARRGRLARTRRSGDLGDERRPQVGDGGLQAADVRSGAGRTSSC